MIIKLKNKFDFSCAVTQLINQTYCFDQYDSQLAIRFFLRSACESAITELKQSLNIIPTSVEEDLLPALA